MDDDQQNPEDNAVGKSPETLSRAINTLEELLEGRGGENPGTAPHPGDALPAEDGQYSIPMLDDVVVPGAELDGNPLVGDELPPRTLLERALAEKLVERLASEIAVIVEIGVEEALRDAGEEIMGRVRNHLDIVLPEILDELSHYAPHDPPPPD